MSEQLHTFTTIRARQERRIRWQHGLTETQARLIASLIYGEVCK